MSVLFPLVVLGVASRLAHERPLLATVVAVVTLACSGARSLLTQRQEQQAAHAMIEAEKKFRILFRDNPQPTVLYDPSTGKFLEINRAATEKYGYTRDEFLALSVADVCPDLPPERVAASLMGLEIRGEVWRQRKRRQRPRSCPVCPHHRIRRTIGPPDGYPGHHREAAL